MTLDEYLSRPGQITARAFCDLIGVKNEAQLRQWRYGYEDNNGRPRRPEPHYCAAIERASAGAVTCEELRDDVKWSRVRDAKWPHPKGRPVVEVVAA
jgi:DNA-binding transcriptional regulator YdaS (Cro superfamily)